MKFIIKNTRNINYFSYFCSDIAILAAMMVGFYSMNHTVMDEKKRIVFIINPISGTSSKANVPEQIDRYIDKEKFDVKIVYTEYAGHAFDIALNSADEGADIVAAVGGDGTVNEVARGVADTQTALAIVPCGSGNGLARHLMLPINVQGALEMINMCEIHDLDYGIINEHPFFCTCGMGFDAFISKKFAQAGKRGALTYLENVLLEGLKYKPETYEVVIDGNEQKYKAFLISVANASQYGNDAYIAPQASMSDGYLDVVIMEPFDILEAAQVGIDMMNKTLDKSSKIKCFKAKDVLIKRKAPGVIHYDGDPVEADAELRVTLRRKGIRIVVNPKADKSRRRPNAVQAAFSQFINEINTMKDEVPNPVKKVKALNSYILRKLN